MATNKKETVFKPACVVIFTCGDSSALKSSCCGILIDASSGLVLTHGSILAPFVLKGSMFHQGIILQNYKTLQCKILMEESPDYRNSIHSGSEQTVSTVETSITNVVSDNQYLDDLQNVGSGKDFHSFLSFSGSIIKIFKCFSFHIALQKLMPGSSWELVDRKADRQNPDSAIFDEEQDHHALTMLSHFVLLQLHNWVSYESKLWLRPTKYCHVGEQVEICSTPFGGLKPEAFLNSFSHGIISNMAGEDKCLILSDARCILGGEGAPLYTIIHSKRYLTGIVVSSLCWKNSEWVGFCIACAIDKVLDSLATDIPGYICNHIRAVPPSNGRQKSLFGGVSLPEVVLLKVGKTWGSGVIISKQQQQAVVLTCSHVIKDAHLYPVKAKMSSAGMLIKTEVIHRQHPLHHQFDLGLLKFSYEDEWLHMTNTIECPRPLVGMKVFVVGHGVFGAEHNLAPSVTSGVISKVLNFHQIPVMIQTTCAVHPGASGGALVDGLGRLLGIVVCNTRDNSSGASFPHVNMSVPLSTVWPAINTFLLTRDTKCLKALTVKNKLLDRMWSLEQVSTASCSQLSRL